MRHYLYVRGKKRAHRAADEIRRAGFSVVSRESGAGRRRLLLVDIPGTSEDEPDQMEQLAKQLRAEYDGWEMTLPE